MGNSSSKEDQSEISAQKHDTHYKIVEVKEDEMNKHKKKALETEQKIQQDVAEAIKKDTAILEQILDDAKYSIDADDSIPNLVHNYAKLRTFEQPQLGHIGSFVDQMKEGWEGIMCRLPDIRKYCGDKGKEKAETMEKIHTDYWRLLLKTRSKIRLILTQCKLQKKNVSALLDILEEGAKDKLSDDDKLAHNDCIRCLGKWIKTDVVQELIKEWKEMSDRLEKESKEWTQLATEAAKYWSNVAWRIAKISVITIVVIGLIVLGTGHLIALAGCAEAAAFSYTTTTLIGYACGVGVAVGSIGAGLVSWEIRNYQQQAIKVRNNINILANKLEEMLNTGKELTNKLNSLQGAQNDLNEVLNYTRNKESLRMIKMALKDIIEYLDEYTEQGNIAMKSIEEAAQKYIDM